jgi:hypothetical protein
MKGRKLVGRTVCEIAHLPDGAILSRRKRGEREIVVKEQVV